jgi:broad specificity phosphatase PhoE
MHANPEPRTPLIIDLLRHGEPEGGVRYRGSQDDPLSATGWRQLEDAVAKMLSDEHSWTLIVSSPMRRCRAFAEHLSARLQLPLKIHEDLRELHFGDLEGLTPQRAWSEHGELLTRLWQAPEQHTPPNGEPFISFRERVTGAIQELIENHQSERLLVLAHGGVIRATLNGLFGMAAPSTFQMEVPYAGATRFSVYADSARNSLQLNWVNRYQGMARD